MYAPAIGLITALSAVSLNLYTPRLKPSSGSLLSTVAQPDNVVSESKPAAIIIFLKRIHDLKFVTVTLVLLH